MLYCGVLGGVLSLTMFLSICILNLLRHGHCLTSSICNDIPVISIKISNSLICICSFDLSSPILKKINLSKMCILYGLVLLKNSSFFSSFFSKHVFFKDPVLQKELFMW